MLITVTTATQRLDTIMTDLQKTQALGWITTQDWYFRLLIQNLGVQDIYLENNGVAVVANSIKVKQNESMSLAASVLGKLQLISDWASNTNVRVLIS